MKDLAGLCRAGWEMGGDFCHFLSNAKNGQNASLTCSIFGRQVVIPRNSKTALTLAMLGSTVVTALGAAAVLKHRHLHRNIFPALGSALAIQTAITGKLAIHMIASHFKGSHPKGSTVDSKNSPGARGPSLDTSGYTAYSH